MARHTLDDLKVGVAVHDMHNGRPDVKELFGPAAEITAEYRLGVPGGHHVINEMVSAAYGTRQMSYVDKYLVLVGRRFVGRDLVHQFAWSYDGREMGFLDVVERTAAATETVVE